MGNPRGRVSIMIMTVFINFSNFVVNSPFYSCELSYLAMNANEAGDDLVLIETSLLFSCKCQLVSIRTT